LKYKAVITGDIVDSRKVEGLQVLLQVLREAITEIERALELDPLSAYINAWVGEVYWFARQYDKAIEKQRWTITMYPNYFIAHHYLGDVYRGKSMIKEAIEEYEKAVSLSGTNHALGEGVLAMAYYEFGKKEQAEKLIDSLKQRSKKEYVAPMSFYNYYIARGDHDQAFKWLERAANERDTFLLAWRVFPIEKYRIPDEPRYNALMKKAGFEKYQQ